MTRTTFLDFALSAEEEARQGRFKKEQPTVIGANAAQYPRLPESSPWALPDPTGPEPPLGFSVDEVPDLGGRGLEAPAVSPSAVETEPRPLILGRRRL